MPPWHGQYSTAFKDAEKILSWDFQLKPGPNNHMVFEKMILKHMVSWQVIQSP